MIGFTNERQLIKDIIIRSQNLPILAEDIISDKPSRETIETELSNCNCYIGIFHEMWGWVPPNNNPEQLSVTALEYEMAKRLGMPHLILVSNLPKEKQLEDFLKKIGDFEEGDWLHHYDDFSQVTGIVGIWLERRVNTISETPKNPTVIKEKLRNHNKKIQLLIPDKIGTIYEKPNDFNSILKHANRNNTWIVGDRGIGKSVILLKITENLEKQGKCVLFLRAEDLHNKKEFLNATKEEFGLTLDELIIHITATEDFYLIVDSVDAVQKKEIWNSFSVELPTLQGISKLRTILAIRKSDYVAFPILFKREWGVEINPKGFSIDQVKKILGKLGILNKIDERLFLILQNPFYLQLLSILVDKGGLTNFSKITNQYQFLQEHYNQVIRNNEKDFELANKKVALLLEIAQKMLEQKRLKISNGLFPTSSEFESLRSDGVILDNEYYIEFFHQVYFDFIMTLKIINSGTIVNFLNKIGSELFLHSTVYFTLAYLHATDIKEFKSNVEEILTSTEISFYWKRVTLEFFADLVDITSVDKEIIEKLLIVDSSLQASFLEYLVERKNSRWYNELADSLIAKWSSDEKFLHGKALVDYIRISTGGS